MGEDPLAGGVGRLTGEIVAEWQESWVLKAPTETSLSARRQQALMNAQFAGGLVNFCLGLDVTAGGRSAYRVAEHNALEDARLLKIYQNSNFNLKKWAEFLQSLRNQRGESAFIQPTLEGLNNFSHYYLDEGEPTARFYDLQNTLDPMGDQIGIGLPMAIQYGGKALVKIGDGFTYVRNRYDDPNYHTQIPYFGSIVVPLLFDGADAFTSFVGLGIEKVATGIGFSQPVAQDLGDLAPLVAGAFGASSVLKPGMWGNLTSNVVKNFSVQSMNVLKKPFTIMRRENAIVPTFNTRYWTESIDFASLFRGGTVGDRNALRQNFIREYPELANVGGWQAHHAIPWDLRENTMLERLGINLNNHQNGVVLPTTKGGTATIHNGPHGSYNLAFEGFLENVENMTVVDTQKKKFVAAGIEKARQNLQSGNFPLKGDKEIIKKYWDTIFNDIVGN